MYSLTIFVVVAICVLTVFNKNNDDDDDAYCKTGFVVDNVHKLLIKTKHNCAIFAIFYSINNNDYSFCHIRILRFIAVMYVLN